MAKNKLQQNWTKRNSRFRDKLVLDWTELNQKQKDLSWFSGRNQSQPGGSRLAVDKKIEKGKSRHLDWIWVNLD